MLAVIKLVTVEIFGNMYRKVNIKYILVKVMYRDGSLNCIIINYTIYNL